LEPEPEPCGGLYPAGTNHRQARLIIFPKSWTMPFGTGLPKYIPSLTYQPQMVVLDVVRDTQDKLVVDLGAGGRKLAPWIETVDLVPTPNTTHVCDFVRGQTPYADDTVDIVIATGVLEHVEDDRLFIAEIRRITKPGGLLHVEMPFLQQYHDDPSDYRRLTLPGLRRFLDDAGFDIVQSGVHIGPTVTLLTLTSYWINLVFQGRTLLGRALATSCFVLFSVIAWPLRYLDIWLIRKPGAHRLAFGVYATAKKRIPL